MEDKNIVELFWQRNPLAIDKAAEKYGRYCRAIAERILENDQDAEECVNDTYLRAWDSIPPQKPETLSTYLAKLTRHLSFDRLRRKNAEKRGGGEIDLVLDELAECISGGDSTEDAYTQKMLTEAIDGFLNTLSKLDCTIFLCRYWHVVSVAEIAKRVGLRENSVSVRLNRMRHKLREYLTERGFDL